MTNTSPAPAKTPVSRIAAWASWDWGSAAFNAVMVTFVFGTYLASDAFGPNDRGTAWLSFGTSVAGVLIAVTAPIIGQRTDRGRSRYVWLAFNTIATIILVALCFFVAPAEQYLLLGVVLISLANIFFEFAEVQYNAILVEISTRENIGRISGFGWGAGYLGGIVLLWLVYTGFISEGPNWFGVPDTDALNVRTVALFAAAWFFVFALPLMYSTIRESVALTSKNESTRVSIAESYKKLWHTLTSMWREDRNTLWFLISSAVYRDAVSAVFTFGAILGTTVYGVAPEDILIFGIAANVVAAAGAFLGGLIEDHLGPRAIVLASIIGLFVVAVVIFFLNGTTAFWIFGLGLCFFVGPIQASSRSFLGRLTTAEQAGEIYGLYATTGRSVSFLTPGLISVAVGLSGDSRMMIPAIALVLAVGFVMVVRVKDPRHHPNNI